HGGLGEHRVEGRTVLGGSQPLDGGRLAQQAGYARQGLQVIGASVLGRQQQEDQVDRLAGEGFELDGVLQSGEDADDSGQRRQAAVGNGNAAPDAGRAELLALQQRVEDGSRLHTRQGGGPLGNLLQGLLFVLRLQGRVDRLRRNEISKVH